MEGDTGGGYHNNNSSTGFDEMIKEAMRREQALIQARIRLTETRNAAARGRMLLRYRSPKLDETLLLYKAIEERTTLPYNAILRVLLMGTRDPNSPLSLLSEDVLRLIYGTLVQGWKQSVVRTYPPYAVGRVNRLNVLRRRFNNEDEVEVEEEGVDPSHLDVIRHRGMDVRLDSIAVYSPRRYRREGTTIDKRPRVAMSPCGQVQFPIPKDVRVNMLPFILGSQESLPEYVQQYHEVISACPVLEEEIGKVCYLTVEECPVLPNRTQRRSGLHIEAPGSIQEGSHFVAAWEHRWGMGFAYSPDELHGGIYMASNTSGSCAVWNALVVDSSLGDVDYHGGMEHLRSFLGPPILLQANQLVWITDRTPHEALPLTHGGYRQFFRLVTSDISVWFHEHSTPNPRVPLPSHVQIIRGSKFKKPRSECKSG